MSRIRANTITNQNANGAPNFPDGITVTGVVTATTTSQNITGDLTVTGNIGVGGTLTYEDVTNIDSVGVITARSGINVSGGEVKVGTAVTVSSGGVITSGIVTATNVSVASSVTAATFHGSGANLTDISSVGGNYYNESIRQNAGGTIGLGSNLWGYHLTENTNSHTFKVFARMGSGTRYIGDNQPAQFMEMWEYSGNVMQ